MPDLQTEIFTKVLPNLSNLKFDDSDEPEETPLPAPTESISLTRQAFGFIKANPNCAGKDVLNFFTAAGHKRPVVASTVSYLIDTNRVKREDGCLLVTRDIYDLPKKVTKVTAPKEKTDTVTTPEFNANSILEGLTILQGRALYDRLKEIYGG